MSKQITEAVKQVIDGADADQVYDRLCPSHESQNAFENRCKSGRLTPDELKAVEELGDIPKVITDDWIAKAYKAAYPDGQISRQGFRDKVGEAVEKAKKASTVQPESKAVTTSKEPAGK